jgi:3-dehydroquinate synthase
VGAGLLHGLGEGVKALAPRARLALVTDSNVWRAWGERAKASLERAGFQVRVLEVAAGEASKSLEVANRLWGELIAGGFSRSDLLVALGGGVVGDLAGFVAATFHRGMPFVQVPTSLLAQVDSSVGGKVAIDHEKGKNLIGAFHAPRWVLADTDVLSTLPVRERWCGLAEMVKAGLIADPALLGMLEAHLEAIAEGSAPSPLLEEVISAAIRVKAEIVSQDEKEGGMRLWLNFGHTVAHGLEAASHFGPLTHGEAVVSGMRAAVVVSERLGKLSAEGRTRAQALLGRFPRPPRISLEPRAVLQAVGWDKKSVEGRVRYVVLDGIGRAGVEPELPRALLEEVVQAAVAELREGDA